MRSHHLPQTRHSKLIIMQNYAAQTQEPNQWKRRFAMMSDCFWPPTNHGVGYAVTYYPKSIATDAGVFFTTFPIFYLNCFTLVYPHSSISFIHNPYYNLFYSPHPMEDILASMWNSLSLSENEAITLKIDELKLSTPQFMLIGKCAIQKIVSSFEVDKNLKAMWGTTTTMETTLLGDNLYLFSFTDEATREHIYDKQPWNYRGSILLLDRPHGHGSPSEFTQYRVLF